MIDATPQEMEIVDGLLSAYVPRCEVRAFGSRAKWEAKDHSDLDLVVKGESELDRGIIADLKDAFAESDLRFRVDVVDWHAVSGAFRDAIEADSVTIRDGGKRKWRETNLGDLVDIKHGFAFKGHSIHDEPKGDVLLTPGNFAIGGGFKSVKFKFYDGEAPDEYVLDQGDLLVTMTDLSKQSDTLGFPALVPERSDGRRYLHNQRLGKVSIKKPELVDAGYLYYVLCSPEYRQEVLASATGTTVKHTSPDRIKQFRFFLPALPEQRRIARVLGALDDKIELNRRMSETLEGMARAVFKDWFVDFGPVRAKMEGREAYLPEDVWGLFPDRLVESEVGLVPEGWGVRTLDDFVEVYGGTTPSTKVDEYWEDGNHWWATPKDLSMLGSPVLLETNRKITDAGLAKIGSGLHPPGTVLLSSRAPIGYLAVAEISVAVNQGFIAMQPRDGVSNLFILFWCGTFNDEIVNSANGSTFLEISKRNFRQIPAVMPVQTVMKAFHEQVNQIYERIVTNVRQAQALADQRDAMLPVLVSGEVGL